MSAFYQIMTEQPGFGETAGKHPAEGTHTINTLALKGGLTGQILIGVGNRVGIGIDPSRVRK